MNASMLNAEDNQPRLKVSIFARLLAALCYIIPAIGGALSSLRLIGVFQVLKANESAGIVAIMTGVNEASLPVIISLYLSAVVGIAAIIVLAVRMMAQTQTASPPIWFFAVGGILGLVPAALFWFAKYLTIEALSPGSSISNSGLGSVGASISQVLLLSLISAPLVIILILIASVLPLSSRPKTKWLPLAAAIVIENLLIAAAVGVPFLINEPKRKNELVKLPEAGYAYRDYDMEKESSMVLTLTADKMIYQRLSRSSGNIAGIPENAVSKIVLPEKLETEMRDKSPNSRIVYLKVDVNVSFGEVVEIFDIIRKAKVDKIGLVVIGKKNPDDPYQIIPRSFEVKLPQPKNTNELVKPNPLTLVAMLEGGGKLTLNREDMGTISDTNRLENKLTEIFKQREYNGVFRENTNEIEKTVFLKVSKTVNYGDFIKLVEAVKTAGAEPIAIQIDDLNL